MDKKKRNILLICAAIFIGFYIARSVAINSMRMAYAQQHANRQRQKQLSKAAVPAEKTADETLATESAALGNLSGVWEGHGPVSGGRGLCDLRLELKQNDPGHYSGYSRFSCLSQQTITNPTDADITKFMNHLYPDAAILTGTVEKGAIHFHTDKTIGTDINGCTVTELAVTPFGAGAVATEWKEGTCQGGNLLMQRAAR